MQNEIKFLLNLKGLNAHREVDEKSITSRCADILIDLLQQYGRVFILSTSEVKKEYASLQLNISATDRHLLLSDAHLLITDNYTLAEVAQKQHTKTIFYSPYAHLFRDRQGKFFTAIPIDNEKQLLTAVTELLNNPASYLK